MNTYCSQCIKKTIPAVECVVKVKDSEQRKEKVYSKDWLYYYYNRRKISVVCVRKKSQTVCVKNGIDIYETVQPSLFQKGDEDPHGGIGCGR